MEYIDGITIIDTSGTILFSIKFDPMWNKGIAESIVGKRFLDVFTDLTPSTSTLFRCMEKGKPIEYTQSLNAPYGKPKTIEGISYPIRLGGAIVGAVEVSRELKSDGDGDHPGWPVSEQGIKDLVRRGGVAFSNKARYSLEDLVYKSSCMGSLVDYARTVADSSSPLLISGATGTGKELFAHGIHQASRRREKPFVVQNCSAIPETLLESILFGTCKGSFTGAVDRKGIFEVADGGTLFLDEIHTMPLHLQAKLLRVIQDGFVRRVGAEKERKIDVRLIAATNIDQDQMMNGEQIRTDLFYRLSVLNLRIPALQERKEDLEPLIEYFVKKYNVILEKNVEGVEPEVLTILKLCDWPGNVRELENVIEAAMNVMPPGKRRIEKSMLPANYQIPEDGYHPKPLKETLEALEVSMIKEALQHLGGNVSEAARALEVPRQTLQQKMKKYSIKVP